MRHHYTPSRMTKIEKSDNTNVNEVVEKLELSYNFDVKKNDVIT